MAVCVFTFLVTFFSLWRPGDSNLSDNWNYESCPFLPDFTLSFHADPKHPVHHVASSQKHNARNAWQPIVTDSNSFTWQVLNTINWIKLKHLSKCMVGRAVARKIFGAFTTWPWILSTRRHFTLSSFLLDDRRSTLSLIDNRTCSYLIECDIRSEISNEIRTFAEILRMRRDSTYLERSMWEIWIWWQVERNGHHTS